MPVFCRITVRLLLFRPKVVIIPEFFSREDARYWHYFVPGARIKSTDEIPDMVARLSPELYQILEERRQQLRLHFCSLNDESISADMIDRIALMPLTIGVHYDIEVLNTLYDAVMLRDSSLLEYVRVWYDNFDVEWTELKCPPQTPLLPMFSNHR